MKRIKIWLISIYDNRRIKNPWIWATIIFYLPSVLLVLPIVIPMLPNIDIKYYIKYISMLIASIWIIFGVVLTNLYFDNIANLTGKYDKERDKGNKLSIINDYFDKLIQKYKILQRIIAIFWCGAVILVLIITKEHIMEFLSIKNIIYYLCLLIYVGITAYIQTFGYSCLVLTIWILQKYYDNFVKIDNVDKLYNLEESIKDLSNFIFNTLISFLSGVLFFPLMYIYADGGNQTVKLAVSFVAFVYVLFLVIYLLYCCYYIKKRSEKVKEINIKKFKEDNKNICKELLNDFEKVEEYNDNQRGKIIETIFNSNMISDIKGIETNPFTQQKIYITIFVLIIPLFKTFMDFKDKVMIYLQWLFK